MCNIDQEVLGVSCEPSQVWQLLVLMDLLVASVSSLTGPKAILQQCSVIQWSRSLSATGSTQPGSCGTGAEGAHHSEAVWWWTV